MDKIKVLEDIVELVVEDEHSSSVFELIAKYNVDTGIEEFCDEFELGFYIERVMEEENFDIFSVLEKLANKKRQEEKEDRLEDKLTSEDRNE